MPEGVYSDAVVPLAISSEESREAPRGRHSALVRITHWINTASFFALVVSGIAILLAHPRLYWGETGGVGGPSLLDLPLPFVFAGQSGWGRALHFQSAWACVLNGCIYVVSGAFSGHFRGRMAESGYNAAQRATYLAVIFLLFPLIVWTGLAMSRAVVSVVPEIVTSFGGQQTARTLHFFAANVAVLFFCVHLILVWRAGFLSHVRAMITGQMRTERA